MRYPQASRDLLLVLAFVALWMVLPRARLLDRALTYDGAFTVVDARSIRDSLGQRWHARTDEVSGDYVGSLDSSRPAVGCFHGASGPLCAWQA
ncbi:MAG: hypothetical protein EBZ31_03350 [Flavobacteriia bacterium]|nr:hypothetical protein [Flavobacteriia bacterium]